MCATTNNVCAMYGVQRRIVVVEELPNRCYETSEHLLALLFQGQPLRFTIIIVIQTDLSDVLMLPTYHWIHPFYLLFMHLFHLLKRTLSSNIWNCNQVHCKSERKSLIVKRTFSTTAHEIPGSENWKWTAWLLEVLGKGPREKVARLLDFVQLKNFLSPFQKCIFGQ